FPKPTQGIRAFVADARLMAKGVYYMAWLRSHGVPLVHGVTAFEASGSDRVEAIKWRQSNEATAQQHVLPCDAIACGFGLLSENQLASLLGCEFVFDEQDRAWQPRVGADGESSRANIYLAGDGARIGGADMAELTGQQCAYRLLQDLNLDYDAKQAKRVTKKIQRGRHTRLLIDNMFAPPVSWLDQADDALVVCRCEEICVGDVRRMLHE